MNKMKQVLRIVLPLVILAGALMVARDLSASAPKVKRKAQVRPSQIVQTLSLELSKTPVQLKLLGRVETVRSLSIQPRVSGGLVYVNELIRKGSRFAKGDLLYKIDERDYEIEKSKVEASISQLEADLILEKGRVRLAKRELELSGLSSKISEEEMQLTLRKPQMAILEAKIRVEQAQLEKANLQISRCEVRAPFAILISEHNAELGQQVSQQSVLARAAGTDSFRVSLKVPARELSLLPEDMRNSRAKISLSGSYKTKSEWEAQFERYLPGVEAKGMMTQLLYLVKNPLDHSVSKRLLAGSFVEANILGNELSGGYLINSEYLHEGDTLCLLKENKLKIQEVEVLWRGKSQVYVTSEVLQVGDQLILTTITGPVNGMPLRVAGNKK
jgi:RND family efflux transporter MFP subunit